MRISRPISLRALDREDAILDEALRQKIKASIADPRPSVPASTVFKRLRSRHARRMKTGGRGA
jgi:antitoxin ParD1/3/4